MHPVSAEREIREAPPEPQQRRWDVALPWVLSAVPATVLAGMVGLNHGGMLFAIYSPWAALVALSGAGVGAAAITAFSQLAAYGLFLQVGAWRNRKWQGAVLLAVAHCLATYAALPRLHSYLFHAP